jgi:CRISPR/Cas system-associated exonuclease Cas4 (RecB family)
MALQLPIYLLAAAEALGLTPDVGEAQYFYATRKGEFKRVRFTGEGLEARREDLERVLTEIDTGMRSGDFHAEPDDKKCGWCEFDSVCDKRRQRFRKRKAADPHAVRVDARKADIA